MLQWARQDHAPAGSAMVVAREIAARVRNGVGWRRPDSLAIAVLARPRTLGPDTVDLAWLVAGLAIAAAMDELTGAQYSCVWPDRVESSSLVDDEPDRPELVISTSSLLGPGRVEHVILTARAAGASQLTAAPEFPVVVVRHLQAAALLLDEPDRVITSYRGHCSTLGTRVEAKMLPSGTIRGVACDVGRDGSLVVESPTGMRERVSVAALDSVIASPE